MTVLPLWTIVNQEKIAKSPKIVIIWIPDITFLEMRNQGGSMQHSAAQNMIFISKILICQVNLRSWGKYNNLQTKLIPLVVNNLAFPLLDNNNPQEISFEQI